MGGPQDIGNLPGSAVHAQRAHDITRNRRIHPEVGGVHLGRNRAGRIGQPVEIALGKPEGSCIDESHELGMVRAVGGTRCAGELDRVGAVRYTHNLRLEHHLVCQVHPARHGKPACGELLARLRRAERERAELHARVHAARQRKRSFTACGAGEDGLDMAHLQTLFGGYLAIRQAHHAPRDGDLG